MGASFERPVKTKNERLETTVPASGSGYRHSIRPREGALVNR